MQFVKSKKGPNILRSRYYHPLSSQNPYGRGFFMAPSGRLLEAPASDMGFRARILSSRAKNLVFTCLK